MLDRQDVASNVALCSNLCVQGVSNIVSHLGVVPKEGPPPYQHRLALIKQLVSYASRAPLHPGAGPQVDAWRPLQASHPLEGPISLRRNWNHRFLTLESEWGNKLRHACVGPLIRRLARDMLRPDFSTVTRELLVYSQTTGSQPREGELSLTEGSNMLLSEMLADEVWP